MKLALYLGSKGSPKDRVIAQFTHGPYSHVEIVIDEGYHVAIPPSIVHPHDKGGALCYSSTSVAPRHGCGFEVIDLNDGKWKVIELPPANWAAAVALALADNGRKYDWQGLVAGFVLRKLPDNKKDRFCSEECVLLMQAAGLLIGIAAARTSPNDLARMFGVL